MSDGSDAALVVDATVQQWTTTSALILLVEEELLVRVTLATMLESAGFKVIPVASADDAFQVLANVPDIRVAVTDGELPSSGMSGFELAQKISAERDIGVVVIRGHTAAQQNEVTVAAYFVAKPSNRTTLPQLVRDLIEDRAGSGERPVLQATQGGQVQAGPGQALTPRQHEVLELLLQGKTNREIAEAMGLSWKTVKVHMAHIFRALGVSSRTEAALAGLPFVKPSEARIRAH